MPPAARPISIADTNHPVGKLEGFFSETLRVKSDAEVVARVVSGHIHVSASEVDVVKARAAMHACRGILPTNELRGRLRSLEARHPPSPCHRGRDRHGSARLTVDASRRSLSLWAGHL